MPRLTAELIAESPQFTNPVKDWELDLRGGDGVLVDCTLFCGGAVEGYCASPDTLTDSRRVPVRVLGLPAVLHISLFNNSHLHILTCFDLFP